MSTNEFPPIPSTRPKRISAVRGLRGETNYSIEVACPHCGRTHRHGTPDAQHPEGHRTSDCVVPGSEAGYFVTLPDALTIFD